MGGGPAPPAWAANSGAASETVDPLTANMNAIATILGGPRSLRSVDVSQPTGPANAPLVPVEAARAVPQAQLLTLLP